MVTHDPQIAARADRQVILRDGLVVRDTLVHQDQAPAGMDTVATLGAGPR